MENREIKFRIFDKKYKEYCEEPDFRWTLSRQGKLYNSEKDEWYDIGERFIVEFFTGLKDKTGQDIYKGDIIEVPDDYDTYGFNAGEKYEIFFNAGGFRCKPKINPKAKGIWLEDDGEFEIIGNIHENPNLL